MSLLFWSRRRPNVPQYLFEYLLPAPVRMHSTQHSTNSVQMSLSACMYCGAMHIREYYIQTHGLSKRQINQSPKQLMSARAAMSIAPASSRAGASSLVRWIKKLLHCKLRFEYTMGSPMLFQYYVCTCILYYTYELYSKVQLRVSCLHIQSIFIFSSRLNIRGSS